MPGPDRTPHSHGFLKDKRTWCLGLIILVLALAAAYFYYSK